MESSEVDPALLQATSDIFGLVSVCKDFLASLGLEANAESALAMTELVMLRVGMLERT